MAQVRLAVVIGELLGGEDEFSIRLEVLLIFPILVEGIDNQLAVSLDRPAFIFPVEHQPTAEPADGRPAALVQHGVGPHGHEPVGRSHVLVVVQFPGDPLLQVELRTTGH